MIRKLNSDYVLKDLLKALKQDDSVAFEKLYHLYSARIYGNILKMVKSQELAKELHQDVFYKVWDKRQLIDPEQSFTSYLFQLSKNTIYNYLRRHNLELQVQNYITFHNLEYYTHIEENLERNESEKLLQESISLLPPKRKQIFEMCKIEGKSYDEVSELLGVSKSTINDHIVKATKFIKERQAILNRDYLLFIAIGSLFQDIN